jgi:hypothetical protein
MPENDVWPVILPISPEFVINLGYDFRRNLSWSSILSPRAVARSSLDTKFLACPDVAPSRGSRDIQSCDRVINLMAWRTRWVHVVPVSRISTDPTSS